jgi:hypothetical protein
MVAGSRTKTDADWFSRYDAKPGDFTRLLEEIGPSAWAFKVSEALSAGPQRDWCVECWCP